MSTRYAPEGAPISYERYMSSPEFAAPRGIPGTAVAAKAQLYGDTRHRNLLFFLQSLSVKEGGLHGVARVLLKLLPGYDETQLTDLLIKLCINPKVEIRDAMRAKSETDCLIEGVQQFQARYEAKVKSDFVLTTIGKEVFETLDHCLDIRKMVVIEGDSGTGKTTAAEAWCAAHQGQARFVSLSGITHKTGFFQKLAMAIGLAASKRKATDMQVKVEEFFRKTGLMLVIDEAHYLWPQHQRSHSNPELVDWVNTALVNHNVPVALICTDQFAKLKARVEKHTGWTSEQFEHRVKRYKKLSNTPTKQDLEAIAAKLLAMRWDTTQLRWEMDGSVPPRDFIKMVVGYALTCKMPIAAVSDAIMEARCQARRNGRVSVASIDLCSALLNYRIPSDAASQKAFQPAKSRQVFATQTVEDWFASGLQRQCMRIA